MTQKEREVKGEQMSSTMELSEEQQDFIAKESHQGGRRLILALIDRADGEIILDYPREIAQSYNCESVLIEDIKSGNINPKMPLYLSSNKMQTQILEIE